MPSTLSPMKVLFWLILVIHMRYRELKKLAKGHDYYIALFAACVHGMKTKIWLSLKQWF